MPEHLYDANLDDPVGKTVGHRLVREPFAYGMQLQKTGRELLQTFRTTSFPKGVYRFHSHEEADEWLMNHLVHPKSLHPARLNGPTWPASVGNTICA